jgi:hypothetical protein
VFFLVQVLIFKLLVSSVRILDLSPVFLPSRVRSAERFSFHAPPIFVAVSLELLGTDLPLAQRIPTRVGVLRSVRWNSPALGAPVREFPVLAPRIGFRPRLQTPGASSRSPGLVVSRFPLCSRFPVSSRRHSVFVFSRP